MVHVGSFYGLRWFNENYMKCLYEHVVHVNFPNYVMTSTVPAPNPIPLTTPIKYGAQKVKETRFLCLG